MLSMTMISKTEGMIKFMFKAFLGTVEDAFRSISEAVFVVGE